MCLTDEEINNGGGETGGDGRNQTMVCFGSEDAPLSLRVSCEFIILRSFSVIAQETDICSARE